jgi:hypothetical protein
MSVGARIGAKVLPALGVVLLIVAAFSAEAAATASTRGPVLPMRALPPAVIAAAAVVAFRWGGRLRGGTAPGPSSPRRPDVPTMTLGVVLAAMGAFVVFVPYEIRLGHMLAIDDPRLGSSPFETSVTLDPRTGEATVAGLDLVPARVGDTFPAPYGRDREREVVVVGVRRSDGTVVAIRTACPTCSTARWDGHQETWTVAGSVEPGLRYGLHLQAGAGPLTVTIRSPGGEVYRRALRPLATVNIEPASCDHVDTCGFVVGQEGSVTLTLSAPGSSPGYGFMLYGHGTRLGTASSRRPALADVFGIGLLVLGIAAIVAAILGRPSRAWRTGALVLGAFAVPVGLLVSDPDDWYWWPAEPIPSLTVLNAGTLVLAFGVMVLAATAIGRRPSNPRATVIGAVTATVIGAFLSVPSLLIRTTDALYLDYPSGYDLGAQVLYLSLYLGVALLALGGWLFGAETLSTPRDGGPAAAEGAPREPTLGPATVGPTASDQRISLT